MKIYIPTRGRWDYTKNNPLIPLQYLPSHWTERTYIVVHKDEAVEYANTLAYMTGEEYMLGHPKLLIMDYDGIADKRTKIGEHAEKIGTKKFMMIDDDLNFLRRVSQFAVNQKTIKVDDKCEIDMMLAHVEHNLNSYAQVGLGMREGNNHAGAGECPLPTECTKAIRAVGYQTDVFRSVDTNRVRTMSDYDTTLQILEKGLKNVVLNWWMSGQKGTNTPGGCATWRTHQIHEESVKRMVELHPGICIPRLKENKTGGDFGKRMELTIRWKKAYEQGVANDRAQRQILDASIQTNQGGSEVSRPAEE